jgi:GNAT superfamily N-acetyltransferase
VNPHEAPPALVTHLRTWLGAWPPDGRVTVVGSAARRAPGWNGQVQPFIGVGDPHGTVLSVPVESADRVRALGDDLDAPGYGDALAAALDRPDRVLGRGVFRWTTAPTPSEDAGVWLATSDPRVPGWLRPFNGGVLLALDREGRYEAGVGVKRHDDAGSELAVVTEVAARGRGLARRLVAQAARAVLARRAVATYLHDPGNTASARTADAAGFPDRGWSVYGLWYRRVP